MVQKQSGNKQAEKSSPHKQAEKSLLLGVATADFEAAAKNRVEAFTNAQTEALETFQEMNQQWLDRVQAEASLASDLAAKLTAARSIPDAIAAYRTWGSRRFEMMAEDTERLWDDTQKFVQAGARLLQSQRTGLGA